MNNWQTLQQTISLTMDGFRQFAFIKSYLRPLVSYHCKKIPYTLTPSENKKVLFYYPIYSILACAEMYTAIKGRGLTKEERIRLTLVAAWATLCDDLVDDHNWSREEVFHILFKKVNEKEYLGNVQLLIAINEELYKTWKVTDEYINQLKIALAWQSESSRQLDPTITLEETLNICRKKNGNTSLMFATLINEKWTEKERKFIYQSAIIGQLTNDAFDMFVDMKNGLHTYINSASSIAQARQFFVDECRILHQYVYDCDDLLQNKKACVRRMSCMHAYALVAFDHLQETENKYGLPMDWKKPSRQELVTDMAFIKNQLRLVKYIKWLPEQ